MRHHNGSYCGTVNKYCRSLGCEITRRLICGIEAHICVLQTAIDLKAAGYQPVIVADCVSSRKELDKELGLKRAEQEGILITSKEAILFELTRKAGGPVFKQISALIK